jgi:hypothetical protein
MEERPRHSQQQQDDPGPEHFQAHDAPEVVQSPYSSLPERTATKSDTTITSEKEHVSFNNAPEVVEAPWSSLPERAESRPDTTTTSEKEPVSPHGHIKVYEDDTEADFPRQGPQGICGLRRRAFYSLLVLSIILITVAAVFGGVFGSKSGSSEDSSTPKK